MVNIYPGQGLTIGAGIVGTNLGQEYDTKTIGDLCKVHGKLITPTGDPVGEATTLLDSSSGSPVLTSGWKGVSVTAQLASAEAVGTEIATTVRQTVETNGAGYFEFYILRGLVVVLTCTYFGKSVAVDTTGHTDIDVSSYF